MVDQPEAADLEEGPGFRRNPQWPTPERVARRAIVLAAIGNRGLMENEAKAIEAPEETRRAMLAWIENSVATDEVEPEEWKALRRPCGTLERQAMVDAVWRLEGLGVLLWALGLYELPPYDELVKPAEVFDAAGLFDGDAARSVIANARLRPVDEFASYQNHATMAHWRFRNFLLRPTSLNFVAYSKGCWIGTFDRTRFRIRNNDLMVGTRVIAKADPEQVETCCSIAHERHMAIDWIMDESGLYSETDTST